MMNSAILQHVERKAVVEGAFCFRTKSGSEKRGIKGYKDSA